MKKYFIILTFLLFTLSNQICNGQITKNRDFFRQVAFYAHISSEKNSSGEESTLILTFKNNSKKDVFISNWNLSPSFYFQKDNEIEISYLPFSYKIPNDGRGWGSSGPAALYPSFLRLKQGKLFQLTLTIPPKKQFDWRLEKGIWSISVKHLWISNISDTKNLYGQKLVEYIKDKGNVVTANTILRVD